mmetsp:Transcript_9243/g.23104  ORF Transcript_9243/g.23104 Transcript_9243/m.23104 type:complete len:227 (+) Transcript_9243:660-1340(+)
MPRAHHPLPVDNKPKLPRPHGDPQDRRPQPGALVVQLVRPPVVPRPAHVGGRLRAFYPDEFGEGAGEVFFELHVLADLFGRRATREAVEDGVIGLDVAGVVGVVVAAVAGVVGIVAVVDRFNSLVPLLVGMVPILQPAFIPVALRVETIRIATFFFLLLLPLRQKLHHQRVPLIHHLIGHLLHIPINLVLSPITLRPHRFIPRVLFHHQPIRPHNRLLLLALPRHV